MYLSSFTTQTLLSLFLFEVHHTTMAKDDSRVMRLRAQKRILADSPLPGTYFLWDNHLIPEGISNTELTTASSNQFIDESGSGHGQSQQPWLQQDPVELLLTDCTTDHSDQSSLLPNGKFQRRQAQIPNACSSQRNIQPGQLKLQQGDQGQDGQGEQTNPGGTPPGGGQVGETSDPENVQALRVKPYPSDLDLLNLLQFGRTRDPNEVCNAFVGQSVPICAPVQVPPQISPAEVVVPSRFCKCAFSL